MLRMTSWSARPIAALARLPWPSALPLAFMPMRRRAGPLTMTTGPTNIVVARTPCIAKASSSTASTAASTTGRYSGLQPAITALIAIFSTVAAASAGGTGPHTSCGARPVASTARRTRAPLRGTTRGPPAPAPARHVAPEIALPSRHGVGEAGVVLAVDGKAGAPRQLAQHRCGHHAGRAIALDDGNETISRQIAHPDSPLTLPPQQHEPGSA